MCLSYLLNNYFQQIHDYYDWLKFDTGQRIWILKNELFTLEKYLEINSQNNDWPDIRKIFQHPIDYELYSDVQHINGYIFYSYRNFSKSIYKPYVDNFASNSLFIEFLIRFAEFSRE